MYIARRVVRMAIEDIGLADPRALEQCMAMQQCVHFLGMPEGDLAIAQAVIYLSVAPKSDAAYRALGDVTQEVQAGRAEPVPMHLRNAPTRAMKAWGYGAGYQHAHQFEDAVNQMECLPESLPGSAGIIRPIAAWRSESRNGWRRSGRCGTKRLADPRSSRR